MSNSTGIPAAHAVDLVLGQTKGLRCYLTGSAVSASTKQLAGFTGFDNAYSDVDLFVGSENEWVRSIQFLIDHGYTFGDRMAMLWQRILHYGTHGWHTNSMRLFNPEGLEVNLVYKTIGRQPVASLSQVLETFDFGLLSMGWETETGTFRDARGYQFAGMDPDGPLPMLPWRAESFKQGHFREHQGMRSFGRAEKYFNQYGFDGSLVLPDMVEGYYNAALYYTNRIEPEKIRQGELYQEIGQLMEARDWGQLSQAAALLPRMNATDEIYELLLEP